MAKARVSKEEHKAIKRAIVGEKFRGRGEDSYIVVAKRFKRSLPTIMRVHATKNHEAYLELVRAEHPPKRKRTLQERFKTSLVVLLHREVIDQADYDHIVKGRKYEPDAD